MYHLFPNPSGTLRRRALSSLVLLTAVGGCNYGFIGGGLPQHVRSIAIASFENATPQPLLGGDVQQALQLELPRNLGVRLSDEASADAVVRGRITRYEETATSVRPSGDRQPIDVPQREVRITFEAEIYDMREDRPLWRAQSQTVTGVFLPDNGETAEQGRILAIEELVTKLVEGAQSQW